MKSEEKIALNIAQRIETIDQKKVFFTTIEGDYLTMDYMNAWIKIWNYMKDAANLSEEELMRFCKEEKVEYIAIYNDDPEITDSGSQRADICLACNFEAEPKGDVGVKYIRDGKYAVFTYVGPYANLGKVYAEVFSKLIPEGGFQLAPAPIFDKYCNDPETTKPEDLITELWIPII